MRCIASIRLLSATALILAGLAYGCGRTSLDDGYVPVEAGGSTGAGGAHAQGGTVGGGGTTGQGGRAGQQGGATGQGGTTGFTCIDASTCSNNQVCCLGVNTLFTSCAPAAQCTGVTRLILCRNDAGCSGTVPTCCVVPAYGLGVCVPRGMSCMLP